MTAQVLNFVSIDDDTVTFTVNNGKVPYSRKINRDGTFSKKGFVYQYVSDEKTINLLEGNFNADGERVRVTDVATRTRPLKQLQSEFPINQRFDFFAKFTNMVLDGEIASAIVTGEGGLGKSHTVMTALENRKMTEGVEYMVVKGYATPKALYSTLFENNGKVIIFDDCDSILRDTTAVNLLKGALDSYDKRTISWLQKGFIDDGLPASFEFTGQVIIISNMESNRLDQAVKSRSIVVDLSMTLQDKIERMQTILPTILTEIDMEIKEAALEFMAEHSEEAREFNMRTLIKAIKVLNAYGLDNPEWKPAVKYLLVQA